MPLYDGSDLEYWAGRHRWVKENRGVPHEALNFSATAEGKFYGFLQIHDNGRLNISRLGAGRNEPSTAGVTVVWCSQL